MKIVVVSDNHGDIESLENIKAVHSDANFLFHCGDSGVALHHLDGFIAVKGNNDYHLNLSKEMIVEVEGIKFLIVHGDQLISFFGKQKLIDRAKELECQVICFGHTHIYEEIYIDECIALNPGSLSHNRDGSKPSYAIILIEHGNINIFRQDYISSCNV